MMLCSGRGRSVEFPRPKIFLSHLNQLTDKKTIVQPQVQVTNKLFPQRDFARRLSTSHQRTKSSIQLRSQRFDLHWTSKRARHLLVQNSQQPVLVQSTQLRPELPTTASHQLPPAYPNHQAKFYSTFNAPHSNSPEAALPPPNPTSPQKNFLRRGSNIQKQIVINLLRNKMLREREVSEKKEYSNSEIIKMIQVFKGVALDEYTRRAALTDPRQKPSHSAKDVQRELIGWENEPFHEFQLQDEKE